MRLPYQHYARQSAFAKFRYTTSIVRHVKHCSLVFKLVVEHKDVFSQTNASNDFQTLGKTLSSWSEMLYWGHLVMNKE